MRRNIKKRGIAPIIATIILVGVVVVLGVISFVWFRGFIKEEGTKFGKNLQAVCEDVKFEADYSSETISLLNTGNVPIFKMKIKKFSSGSYTTEELQGMSNLKQGDSFSGSLTLTVIQKIVVIPVLLGTVGKASKTYVCGDEYGQEITL
jgi:flagellin-like protein